MSGFLFFFHLFLSLSLSLFLFLSHAHSPKLTLTHSHPHNPTHISSFPFSLPPTNENLPLPPSPSQKRKEKNKTLTLRTHSQRPSPLPFPTLLTPSSPLRNLTPPNQVPLKPIPNPHSHPKRKSTLITTPFPLPPPKLHKRTHNFKDIAEREEPTWSSRFTIKKRLSFFGLYNGGITRWEGLSLGVFWGGGEIFGKY